jgi:hypothetical protein
MGRLFRKHWQPEADPVPPGGVVLHYNGREIGCDVLREPDQDTRGVTAWLAVPAETVTIRPGDEVRVTAALLPAGSQLLVDFECERFQGPDPGEMLRDTY